MSGCGSVSEMFLVFFFVNYLVKKVFFSPPPRLKLEVLIYSSPYILETLYSATLSSLFLVLLYDVSSFLLFLFIIAILIVNKSTFVLLSSLLPFLCFRLCWWLHCLNGCALCAWLHNENKHAGPRGRSRSPSPFARRRGPRRIGSPLAPSNVAMIRNLPFEATRDDVSEYDNAMILYMHLIPSLPPWASIFSTNQALALS